MRKLFSLMMLCAVALRGLCASAQTTGPLGWMFERADSLNTSLQASRMAVESARSGESVARNAYLPSVDVSLSLSYNGDGYIMDRDFRGGFKAEIPSFGNNFKLEVSQVIFAGGAIIHGVSIAELGTEMATFEADKNRGEVRFLIAGDYIELCKLSGQLKVVDANIGLARQVKERMETRVENGVALKTDITRLELLIENLSYSRLQVESAIQIVSRELCNALKMDTPPAPVEYIGGFHPEGNWVEEALGNAPALKLADAEADYRRYSNLLEKDAVTQQQFDEVKTKYEGLKAKVATMERQIGTTRSARSEQEIRRQQSQGGIQLAEAALNLARLNLSYTVITAPCDGVTSAKTIQSGELLMPGQRLLSIVSSQAPWVTANFRESQLGNIHVGDEVEISVDALKGEKFTGRVEAIADATGAQYSPMAPDNATGNFVKIEQRIPVKICFTDGPVELLASGMNVTCKVRR